MKTLVHTSVNAARKSACATRVLWHSNELLFQQPLFACRDFTQLNHQSQGLVDSSFVRKRLSDVRIEEDQVCASVKSFGVLPSRGSFEQLAKIIFRPQFIGRFIPVLLHELFVP